MNFATATLTKSTMWYKLGGTKAAPMLKFSSPVSISEKSLSKMLKAGTPGAPQPNVHLGGSKPTKRNDLPDTPEERDKQEWARQMRLKFVTDKKMIHEDGSLNLEYA
jgi:hypothetical protein